MNPLKGVLNRLAPLDWNDTSFDLRKAYVCSLFSELAYHEIPHFEYRLSQRASVIPCAAYQTLFSARTETGIEELVREGELGPSFSVIRRYAVVVGVRTPTMIIVSVRGTAFLYDWLTNLRATKCTHPLGNGAAQFHKGFYTAALACLGDVMRGISRLSPPELLPIYITGHSLGGAISAILSNMLGRRFFDLPSPREGKSRWPVFGCYTFGMPRYGDLYAVANTREPYHVYNDADIVPTLPPRWMGFENCFNEYRLNGVGVENVQSRETLNFLKWTASLISGTGIAAHQMELYRDRIKGYI
ncbi:lipase family protein [Agrobacterium pusense]|uniref:lipase family protein n=1 Tax=Agrobacterium pusense TaxID=648995 RepID=UPI00345EE31E